MSEPNPYEGPKLVIDNDKLGESAPKAPLKGGGGGGTYDGMEPRVAALEQAFGRVDAKLDILISDIAYLKGRAEGLPTAVSFGELKGRVDSLPTLGKIATIVALVGGAMTVIIKWSEMVAALPH